MPGPVVVSTAQLACSFGAAPAPLVVLPVGRVLSGGLPVATVADHLPLVNIPSFGMCKAPTNPAVIAATAAASGVFTQAPCVPATAAPWTPGSPAVVVGGKPVVTTTSKCLCTWAGVVSVVSPGQVTVTA